MNKPKSQNGWFHKPTGKTFILKEGLCAFLSIDEFMFKKKLESGEIIEVKKVKEKKGKNAITVEYKGVVYNSYRELCDAFQIVSSTFTASLRKGLTVEQAVERGLKNVSAKSN